MTVTFRVLRCLLEWRLNPAGFGTQKKCPFNRGNRRAGQKRYVVQEGYVGQKR